MPIVVYRYGIASPHENADLVYDQLRLAHEYRRNLVLIERGRRHAERQVRSSFSAELQAAEQAVRVADAACEAIASGIRAVRKQDRKRSETGAQKLALAQARDNVRSAKKSLYEIRARFAPQCPDCRKAKSETMPCPHATPEGRELRNALDVVDETATALWRNAREYCGVYWGTYLLVERAHNASRAMPLYADDGVSPNDPKLPGAWDGSGSIGVQIQSSDPLSTNGAIACTDTRLQIKESPYPEEWLATANLEARPPRRPDSIVGTGRGRRPPGTVPGKKGEPDTFNPLAKRVLKRARRHGQLQMRIGSNGREPVWGIWRLDYHRPLPKGANITWATAHRRAIGPHFEWSLCVTVDVPQVDDGEAAVDERPSVAIDVGWRQIGDELRVAAWHDSEGRSGEFRLTAADIRALRAYEAIRVQRDMSQDLCRMRLKQWIDAVPNAPEWMREASKTMSSWRQPRRLVRFLQRWNAERPTRGPAEEIAYCDLEAWTASDRARWAEESHRRIWGLRRRKWRYQNFAAWLATTYSTIVMEKFDLRVVAVRRDDKVVGAQPENETARSNRQMASISELSAVICNAVRVRRSQVVAVNAVDSTSTCPACGLVADRHPEDGVVLVCDCGHHWDQDVQGSAPILLGRWIEHPGDAKILAGARKEKPAKKSDRWGRARRMGDAKKARIEAARKAVANGA
jgi:hypothetical protein